MSRSIFSPFTNLYPIQKTLRRELKPLNENFQHDPALSALRNSEIPQRDEQREKDYQAIKPLLDEFHNQFITESLHSLEPQDRSDFILFYQTYQKKKKNKAEISEKELKSLDEEFESRTKALRNAIGTSFSVTAELRKSNPDYVSEKGKPFLTQKSYKILTEAGVLWLLEKKYTSDPEKLALIRRFGNFFTYFTGFNQNRENYYATDEKSTAVAYRAINENLLTFANNCELFEKLSVLSLSELEKKTFNPDSYSEYLTQSGIVFYNEMLANIRSKANLYTQEHKAKLPQPKLLYKQIWSPRGDTIPFDLIASEAEFQETLHTMIRETDQRIPEFNKLLEQIFEEKVDLSQIFFSKTSLNIISNRYFSSWHTLLEKGVELKLFKFKKNDEESFKLPAYLSLAELKELLESAPFQMAEKADADEEKHHQASLFKLQRENLHLEKSHSNWELLLKSMKSDFESFWTWEGEFWSYTLAKKALQSLSALESTNQEHKNLIKMLLDNALYAYRMLKWFKVDTSKLGFVPEGEFYPSLDQLLQDYPLPKWYDMIRNYLTRKTYSQAKLKLNFDCSTLLNGRDKNKEIQNLSVILRKDGKFYLAIMKKDQNKFFENSALYEGNLGTMEKMDYKLLPWANKMLPKCLMPGSDKKKYGASDQVLELYAKGSFKKSEKSFNLADLHTLIDFYKLALPKYEDWKVFNFQFQATENYQDISQFYREVEQQGYLLNWRKVNEKLIKQGIKDWSLFLFQISSKDFEGKSKTPDLQTLYWQQLFEFSTNVKLNGEAEIFFRPWSMKKEKKKLKVDNYDVFKHKRYTEDKILFHVPITLWFGNNEVSPSAPSKFNQKLNQELIIPHFDDLHVIGVDRWEKHLAFYSVVSVKTGKIVKQGTLNLLNGTDYEAKLSQKAENRLYARQNRDTIEKIADLKNGYISQVVNKLVELVLEYNAVIVFEDLNAGFKRGRQKIEQSVYQKLELALAKKLNFIVKKEKAVGEPWSVTSAYQLAPQINTFWDIKWKQRGIMLYTRANYTSVTDPLTGWRKQYYFKKGSSEEMKAQFFKSFKNLTRDAGQEAYIFDDGTWLLYSNVERRRGKRGDHRERTQIKYDPSLELDTLFSKYQIEKSDSLFDQLKNRELPQTFWTSFFRIIDLIMQIRNIDDEGRDIILSPIGNPQERFDSRKRYNQLPRDEKGGIIEESAFEYPTSWDANGAYNIARKGVMMLERIKENPEKPDLLIRDAEWDKKITRK